MKWMMKDTRMHAHASYLFLTIVICFVLICFYSGVGQVIGSGH